MSKVIDMIQTGNFWKALLAETIFYPGGGGQPEDRGTINGIPVEKVERDDLGIWHFLRSPLSSEEVELEIDFEWRYDFMQQHTAQHLISQIVDRHFKAKTLSFSMNEETSSIEIENRGLNRDSVWLIEDECFRLIQRNLEVKIHPDFTDFSKLRKPPKVNEQIRVVEIDSFDYSACGGLHVKSLAELGVIKIIKIEQIRQNDRLYYLAGFRALRDYQQIRDKLTSAAALLSTSIEKFMDTLDLYINRCRVDLNNSLQRCFQLYQQIVHEKSKQSEPVLLVVDDQLEMMKRIAAWALKEKIELFLLQNETNRFVFASERLKEKPELMQFFLKAISARGGGRGGIVEGSLEREISANELRQRIKVL